MCPALAVVLACSVVLSACDDDRLVDGGLEVGTSWVLTSMTVDGAEVKLVEALPVTLERTDQVISGRAACNQYGTDGQLGTDQGDEGEVVFPSLFMTEMACTEPGVMEVERVFLDAMAAACEMEPLCGRWRLTSRILARAGWGSSRLFGQERNE